MVTSEDDRKASAAFEQYLKAKDLADRTKQFRDGKRAANLWVRFLNHFLPAEKRMPPNVVALHRRKGPN